MIQLRSVSTARGSEYRIGATGHGTLLPPIYVSLNHGPFDVQDYFSAADARALADALNRAADEAEAS